MTMLVSRRPVLLAPLLLLAACAPRAAASPVSVCRGRAESCSGHGDCAPQRRLQGRWACSCDPGYEGERCDIWRAPSRDLAELPPALRDVRWHNCTHGIERNEIHSPLRSSPTRLVLAVSSGMPKQRVLWLPCTSRAMGLGRTRRRGSNCTSKRTLRGMLKRRPDWAPRTSRATA